MELDLGGGRMAARTMETLMEASAETEAEKRRGGVE